MSDKERQKPDREERLPQPGLDEEPTGEPGREEEPDGEPGEPTVEQPSRPALDPEEPADEERHFGS